MSALESEVYINVVHRVSGWGWLHTDRPFLATKTSSSSLDSELENIRSSIYGFGALRDMPPILQVSCYSILNILLNEMVVFNVFST